MCAAIMLWMGPSFALDYGFIFALLGGLLTVFMMVVKRFPVVPVVGGTEWYGRLAHPETGVPYGIALAAGALLVYPYTHLYISLIGV